MIKEEIKQIKRKMETLVNRWNGKEIVPGSTDEIRRKIDRMIYRSLKRKLDKLPETAVALSQVSIAKEVFGVKD